jgi:hydrogenase maturation protease
VKPLFIAIGNRYRRDDGVAIALAGRLQAEGSPDFDFVEVSDDVIRLVDLWENREFVIVADAVIAGQEPGTIYRRDPIASQLPRHWFGISSSHQLGIVEAIELGRAMRRLPRRMLFVGIEVQDVAPGEGLTPEVELALTPALHVVKAATAWALSGPSAAADRRPAR